MRTAGRLLLGAMTVVMVGAATTGGAMAAPPPAPVAGQPQAPSSVRTTVASGGPVSQTNSSGVATPQLGSPRIDPVSHIPMGKGKSLSLPLGIAAQPQAVEIPQADPAPAGTDPAASTPSGAPATPNAVPAATPSSSPPENTTSGGVSPATAQYFISGTVTDSHGVGIQGITVTAYNVANGCCLWGVTATTQAGGAYTLLLYSAIWNITFNDPLGGYLATWYTGPVDITAGGTSGIDVSLVARPKIVGHVTNSASAALVGITVRVFATSGGGWGLEGAATTGADGAYSYTANQNAEYRVCFQDPADTYAGGCHADGDLVDAVGDATTVAVALTDVSVDAQLFKWVTLSGVVTNGHGIPVPNISVHGNGSGSASDINGSYTARLHAHHAIISMWRVDGSQSPVWYAASGPTYDSGGATSIMVGETDLTLDLVMPDPTHLSGVVSSGVTGLGSIEVDFYRNGNYYRNTYTAVDGSYSYPVPPGTYQIGFFNAGYTYGIGWYSNGGFTADPSRASFVTVTDADVTGLNVILPVSNFLFGKVTSPTGSGLASGYVEAYIDGGFYAATYTASNGSYALPVIPGKCTIWAYDLSGTYAGGWRLGSSVTADPTKATVLTVGSASVTGVNVALKTAAHIKGRITVTTGIGNIFFVEAFGSGISDAFAYTDTNGNYSIPVLPGTYSVWADDHQTEDWRTNAYAGGWNGTAGYTTNGANAKPVVVAASPDVTVNLVLPLGVYITGQVKDRYGQGLSEIDTEVFVNGTLYLSDLSSSYSIRVAPGTYEIGFYDPYGFYAPGWYNVRGIASHFADATPVVVGSGGLVGPSGGLKVYGKPDVPSGATAVPYNNSARVSWSPPLFDGGHSITGYTVTAAPDGATCTTTVATICTVTGLANGTPYTFTVTATNSLGTSDPSVASDPVTPMAVPDAPVVTGKAGNALVLISWTTPADNGYAITGYTVTSSPSSAGCTGVPSATSCTVSGLTNGQAYTFTVVASNSQGPGAPGSSSQVIPVALMSRYSGPDNFATAAAVSANTWQSPCHCTAYIAYGYNFPDALAGAAAAGSVHGPVLFVATTGAINANTAAELTRLAPDRIVALGGTGVISDAVFSALGAYAPPGQTARYSGADRYATATAVSANTFGANCGCTVYIAFAMNFPDALAGAAAAGTVPGPVLLVATTGAVNASTKAELLRLKPNRIVVLGGTGVVSAAVYNALGAYAPAGHMARYYGADRYATASSISSHTFGASCGCVVYISAGTDFNGALAAAAAAGTIKGPLLLVGTTGAIPPATVTELTRLKPARIVVIGNTSMVSDAVYNLLKAYAPTS